MNYSPKLKKAMSEIEAILNKHDIAGTIVIHTPGFSEYLNKLNTSYSCVKNTVEGIRIKANKEIYGEKLNDVVRDSVNMLHHLSNRTGENALHLLDLSEKMDKLTDAKYFGGGHTTNQSQNN